MTSSQTPRRSGLLWKLVAPTAVIFMVAAAFMQLQGWRAVNAQFAVQSEERLAAHERVLVNLVGQVRNEFSHIGNELLNAVRSTGPDEFARRIEDSTDLFARLNWAAILDVNGQTTASWSALTPLSGEAPPHAGVPGLLAAVLGARRPVSWALCPRECELVIGVPGSLDGRIVGVLLAVPMSDLLAPFKSLTGADAALLHIEEDGASITAQTTSLLREQDSRLFTGPLTAGPNQRTFGDRNFSYRVVELAEGMGPRERIRALLLHDITAAQHAARKQAFLHLLEFLLVGALGLTLVAFLLRRNLSRLEALIDVLPRLSETGDYQATRQALLDASPPQRYEDEVGTLRDTLRSLSERLQTLHGAEAESDAKSRFLATMSHEIRTPMSGILGLTEILAQTPLNPDQARMAQMIHDSTHNLLHIINDVLDYSKLEAGAAEIDPTPFSPLELLESIADIISVSAARKNISLRVLPAPDLPAALLGDMGKIRQVILNLASNAVKFTDSGHVTLSLHGTVSHTGRFQAVFTVQDSGIGIRKEAQSQVFERFRQAESGTTRMYGGTGLGLAISRGLIDLMHGRVELTSVPGEGSTFSVHLDLPVASSYAPPKPVLNGLKVAVLLPADERNCVVDHVRRLGASVVDKSARADVVLQLPFGGDATQIEILAPQQPEKPAASLARPVRIRELAATIRDATRTDRQTPKPHAAVLRQFGARVLVAEDQAVNREMLGRQLRNLGCEYVLCCNGAEALHVLEADSRFDLLITDLHMPEMDGYQLVTKVRQSPDESLSQLPIVVLTASASTKDMARLNRHKVNRKLVKPASLTALEQCLGDFLTPDADTEREVMPIGDTVTDNAPLIDRALLRDVMGDDLSILERYEQMYEELTLPQLEECAEALEKGDLETVQSIAHKLAGSTRALGGVRLAGWMKELEHGAEAHEPQLDRILRRIQSTMPVFLSELKGLAASG